MVFKLSQAQLEEIQAALLEFRKIEAIKLFREATGAGLKEAKDFVEELESQLAHNPSARLSQLAAGADEPTFDDAAIDGIQQALFNNKKIAAIKLYRAQTGQGLKESKDFVEAIERRLRRESPERFAPRTTAWGGWIAIAIVVAGALVGAAIAMR